MRKRTSIFILIIVLTLSGCSFYSNAPKDSKFVVLYNGNFYEEIKDWQMIDESKSLALSAWAGFEYKIQNNINNLKNNAKIQTFTKDNEEKFISYENVLFEKELYHKTNDKLPDYHFNEGKVEKIVLKSYYQRREVLITGKNLKELLTFIENSEKESSKRIVEERRKGPELFGVDVYFENYPAYFKLGSIGWTKSGRIGYASYEIKGFDANTKYIVFSDTLTTMIKSFIP
ncbi:MAG: hypothetical protein WCQ41_02200 [Bacillota bacterium]